MRQCQRGQRGPVSPQKGVPMPYVFGAYHLDPQRYELHHAGVLVPLRPKVFQVLAYLVAQHDRVVGKEELLEALWPGQFVGDVGLNTYIMEVRKALGDRHPLHRCPTGSRPRAGEYGKAGGAIGKHSMDTATMRKRGNMGAISRKVCVTSIRTLRSGVMGNYHAPAPR